MKRFIAVVASLAFCMQMVSFAASTKGTDVTGKVVGSDVTATNSVTTPTVIADRVTATVGVTTPMLTVTSSTNVVVNGSVTGSDVGATYGVTGASLAVSGASVLHAISGTTASLTTITGTSLATGSGAISGGDITATYSLNGATLNVSGVATFTAAPVLSAGKIGFVDSQGNANYTCIITTVMPSQSGGIGLTLADGKAGFFDVTIGTYSVFGSFTTGAAVTLTTASSASVSTTANNAATINAYDGGTVVYIENKSGSTLTARIRYTYVN